MALSIPPFLRCLRSFSTTLHTPKPAAQSLHSRYTQRPPPYPYGPAQHYKQANTGLYGGARIQSGNKISKEHGVKTRRTWLPNIRHKRLWSDALGKFLRVKVQARVLRTIDKCGGLDEYLLGDKPARIKELGVEGWRLRWMVMRTEKVKKRMREERVALGLVEPETAEERRKRIDARKKRINTKQKRRAESAEKKRLADEVARASSEVVSQIQRTEATEEVPPVAEAALETRINLTTRAIQAELEAAHPSPPAPTTPPQRRSPMVARKRARRAVQILGNEPPSPQITTTTAEVANIEEAVSAATANAEPETRERLETAMQKLRDASRELERVKTDAAEKVEAAKKVEAAEKQKAKKKEKAQGNKQEKEKGALGGILDKIRGLFRFSRR